MATLEQLSEALIKADAAGNSADAKMFADEIRRLRASQAQAQVEPTTEGMPAQRKDFASMTPAEKQAAKFAGVKFAREVTSGAVNAIPSAYQNIVELTGLEPAQQKVVNAISGAGNVPYDPGAVRRSQESFAYEMTGGDPTSSAARGAELAVQLGLSPVGPKLIGGAVGKILPRFGKAIETGGLAKTVADSRVADYAARLAGGAISGAAATAPMARTGEEVMLGGILGGALPGLGLPVAGLVPIVRNALSPTTRAQNILREAAGPEISKIRAAAAAAPDELTAAQAIAGTDAKELQAIAQNMQEREALRLTEPKLAAQQAAHEDVLNRMAGGATQTEAVGRTKQMAGALREQTVPMLEQSLTRANQITDELLRLETIAPQLSKEAAAEVANVRRLVNAGNVAEAASKLAAVKKGMPYWESSYTYPAKLSRKSGEWADQAAARSLELGQEASQAAGTAATMRAAGVEPLTADALKSKIKSVVTVEQSGNDTLKSAVNKVLKDIDSAAAATGAVDARAIYAIRKNSVNEFIKKMFPGAMDSAQKAEAARIVAEINPIIDDAISKAGGKGFQDYLKSYSEGQRVIERSEMAAKLRDLYKTDKKAFVNIVSGNNVDAVRDVFGSAKFDISKEMGDSLMKQLRPIADDIMRTERMKDLAQKGAAYAGEIVSRNQPVLRVPSLLPKSEAANAILGSMQSRLPKATLDQLEKALVSGKSLNEVLSSVPQKDRLFLRKLIEGYKSAPGVAPAAISNALVGENKNSLVEQ